VSTTPHISNKLIGRIRFFVKRVSKRQVDFYAPLRSPIQAKEAFVRPNYRKLLAIPALAVAGGALAFLSGPTALTAADHFDPPARVDPAANPQADIAADMADVYLYHTATSLIVSLDFAGPRPANESAFYDRDVDYNILLSNAGSTTDSEFTINFRFGQDPAVPNSNGIRITGIPGTTGAIVGSAETIISQQGVRVFAGLIDDPFNFDAVGLRLTRESGTLMFNNQRNRFAQMNTTAVIIEIPLASIRNGTNPISAWATTARIIPA
jgi:hypothetical protein